MPNKKSLYIKPKKSFTIKIKSGVKKVFFSFKPQFYSPDLRSVRFYPCKIALAEPSSGHVQYENFLGINNSAGFTEYSQFSAISSRQRSTPALKQNINC